RMAEIIGGKLEISSTPNVGTRVLMSFPAQAAGATAVANEQRKYG
ncbi:MAG: Histidine kinase protein, partial [Deltaproteobacteria bacterium]|nr:Histidine kinase protein [Deltaproteobacteria bacterium]